MRKLWCESLSVGQQVDAGVVLCVRHHLLSLFDDSCWLMVISALITHTNRCSDLLQDLRRRGSGEHEAGGGSSGADPPL